MKFIENFRKTTRFKNYVTYIVLAAALVILIILSSSGMLNRSMTNLLPKIVYSIILAISLNLVVGFLGELSLGHAGFMCIGAYLGGMLSMSLYSVIPNILVCFLISALAGGLAASVFGFIIGLPALRLKGDYLAIVTLAFGEIVRNVFKNLPFFGRAMGYATNEILIPGKTLFIVSAILLLILLALIQNLIRSKHGRAVTAIRDNEIAARSMGINVTFYKLLVFVLSSFCAGVAGVIYAHYVTPVMYTAFDYNYSIEILVMVVIGGIGSMNGSIVAAALITLINSMLQNYLSGDLAAVRLLVYALILIFTVIFNNAPALKPLKEKISIRNIAARYRLKKHPEKRADDHAEWNRIETKIKMDELLSVDVNNNDPFEADAPSKKGDQ